MTEKKEVMNRSEALTHVADGQKDRGEEKERQTENDDNETWQGEASGGRRRQRDTARRSATAKGRHEEDMSQTSWFGQKKSTIQADTRTSVPQTCAQNVKNRSLMAVTVFDVDLAADSERRRKEYEDGLRQRGDGEKQQEGEQQKEVNDGGMRQEKQQQQSTRRQENVTQRWQGQKGKDTLIKTIELRMKQEETQERVSGEKEAR